MVYLSVGGCSRIAKFISDKLSRVQIGREVSSEIDAKINPNCTQIETIDLLIKMIEKFNLDPPLEIKFTRIKQFYECLSKCGYLFQSSVVSLWFTCGDGFNTHRELEKFFETHNITHYNNIRFKEVRVKGDGVSQIIIHSIPTNVEYLCLDSVNVDSTLLINAFELKSLQFVALGGDDYNIGSEVFCNLLPNSITNLYLDLNYCQINEIFIEFPIGVKNLVFKLNHDVLLENFDIHYLNNLCHLSLEGIDLNGIPSLKFPISLTRLFLKNTNMDRFTDLDKLSGIKELSIKEDYLDGMFLNQLENLSNLQEFQYRENKSNPKKLTKTIRNSIQIIKLPPKLEFMEIKSQHLNISSFEFHRRLKFLYLEDITIEGSKLSLSKAPNLHQVMIENTNVKQIYGFENCKKLKFLKIKKFPIHKYLKDNSDQH